MNATRNSLVARWVLATEEGTLGQLFDELVAEHGSQRASELWWQLFSATDVTET